MELKSQDGFELVKTEDLHKLKKISEFLNDSRMIGSLAKTWRLLEKLSKMLEDLQERSKV